MDSTVGGGWMIQEDEWAKEKRGGVLLREGKMGGGYLGEEKNGGSTHLRPKAAPL